MSDFFLACIICAGALVAATIGMRIAKAAGWLEDRR